MKAETPFHPRKTAGRFGGKPRNLVTAMRSHCDYSFADLYEAAFGAAPERQVLEELYGLTQHERNIVVRDWVARAGWETVEIVGTDGVTYASFGPEGSLPCA